MRKTDARIEALGDLDEAQAVIGVARAMALRTTLARELLALQQGLYVAMAEVATPREDLGRLRERLDLGAVERLDAAIDAGRRAAPVEGRFVIPGDSPLPAALHHARTVLRRAERRVVTCVDAGLVSGETLLPWLNRASDLLFVLARVSERRARRRS